MKTGKRIDNYLMSKIMVDAKQLSSMSEVKKTLGSCPGLSLVHEGSVLAYEISVGHALDHFFFLELGRKQVCLTLYSRENPALLMREAMLTFLGFLQILNRCYTADVGSLYPYLVMILANQQIERIAKVRPAGEEQQPELTLARRLISLIKENSALKEENYRISGKMRRATVEAIAHSGGSSAEEVAEILQLNKREVLEALAWARESGYRLARTGEQNFSLVRV